MSSASPRAHRFVAIWFVACSMLMHEILLTRVCALRLYFHFAFLVISNCLLGLGVSGALLVTYQERWKRAPRLWLGRFCVATTSLTSSTTRSGGTPSPRPNASPTFRRRRKATRS